MRHVITALLVALFTETLVAATFTVTNNNDAGAGSLRDAVAQSNTRPGPTRSISPLRAPSS